MKKALKITALLLVLLMAFSILVSCDDDDKKDSSGTSALNPTEPMNNLEITPASNPTEAKSNLKEAGYWVTLIEDESALSSMVGINGLKAYLVAENEEDEADGICILYFEDADAADAAWEDIKEDANEIEIEDLVVKKSGGMIWYGTKAAIKAAK